MAKKKPRGPKGGVKHQPGRGHDRKGGPSKKNRFIARQERKRQAEAEELRRRWEQWDSMSEEVRKLMRLKETEQSRPPDA